MKSKFKIDKIPEYDLSSIYKEGFSTKIYLPWGYASIYIYRRNHLKWDWEIYWTDDEGSDITVSIEKNSVFDCGETTETKNIKEIVFKYCCAILYKYFEDHPIYRKIEKVKDKLATLAEEELDYV